MPPPAVKTIRDLIYWQYAKIISESAGAGKKQYAFVMNRFKKLQSGEIEWSGAIREYIREREMPDQCLYCGSTQNLSYDHLISRNRNGPDIPDNVVLCCRSCNSSKGDKGVYEWFQLDRRYEVPRVVEGKYLKLLYQLHAENDTLTAGRADLTRLCQGCELGALCPGRSFRSIAWKASCAGSGPDAGEASFFARPACFTGAPAAAGRSEEKR